MIINKVDKYWTEEERAQVAALDKRQTALDNSISDNMPTEQYKPIADEIQRIIKEVLSISFAVEDRYIKSRTLQEILDDAREIVNSITKADFKKYIDARNKQLDLYPTDEALAPLREETQENYQNAYYYILYYLRVQLNAVADDEERTEKIISFAESKAAKWYPKDLSLPAVKYKKSHKLEMTIDKMSYVFFGFNPPASKGHIDGQMSFTELIEQPKEQYIPVKYEKDGQPEITLYYNYSFDDSVMERLGLEKRIDDEDYFIMSFIDNFHRAGNTKVSVTKFFKEMTGAEPNTTQLTNLTNKLTKLATSSIFINDLSARKAWGLKTYREAVRRVAPIDITAERYITNGRVSESTIHIYDAPLIMQLGYQIGQYTTVPKSLLYVKKKVGKNEWRNVSRTPRFYRVLHYLLRRIASSKLNSRILYNTFYQETGERTTANKNAAKKVMFEILEWFRHEDYISSYKEEPTPTTGEMGVSIRRPHDAPKITKKR